MKLYQVFPLLMFAVLSIPSFANTITLREFVKDGKTYIEQKQQNVDGSTSTITYPKLGSEPGTTNTTIAHPAPGKVVTTTKYNSAYMKGSISLHENEEEHAKRNKEVREEMNALVNCLPYKANLPHPLFPTERRHIQVQGTTDGKCKYTETMPNNGLLTCSFTEAQREEIKKSEISAFQRFVNDTAVCTISGY